MARQRVQGMSAPRPDLSGGPIRSQVPVAGWDRATAFERMNSTMSLCRRCGSIVHAEYENQHYGWHERLSDFLTREF